MPRLEQWSVVSPQGPYTTPEHRKVCLEGVVYDHPKMEDGKSVVTSPIAKAEGLLVTTKNGTVYELGAPAEHYLRWCADNTIPFDPSNPIRTLA